METQDQEGESWESKKNEDKKSESPGILMKSEDMG